MFDYTACRKDELSFKGGEVLAILEYDASGWWKAQRIVGDRVIGWIPSNYVQPTTQII